MFIVGVVSGVIAWHGTEGTVRFLKSIRGVKHNESRDSNGGSGAQYKGVMNNGIFTVISDYDAPTFVVPLLLDGTRWNRKVPNSAGYSGWVFKAATEQWLAISKVVA